jgi:GNAT superfamily N-acetyltransferase
LRAKDSLSGVPDVRAVDSRAGLNRFLRYPFERYRDDPHWVPPLLIDERRKFDPRKNPFYRHARVDLFLAGRDGRVVGRVAAIDDDNHNATHDDNLLFFGFFEAEDRQAAEALLDKVEERARELGRDAVRGPANHSMNDGAGFQMDAFDTDPYVMMPHNPPEYPRWVEAAGYRKVKDLYAWRFESSRELGERIGRLAERVRRRQPLTVRPVDRRRFGEELTVVKHLYDEAWEKNWGFVRYTDAEFDHLAGELRLILDTDLALFVEIDGKPVGMGICLPDANQVLKRARGRLFPHGAIAFLRRGKIIDRLRLAILGVLAEHRGKGLEAVIIHELYKRAIPKGYRECECSWVLEDNRAMNRGIAAAGAELYKTYRMYQKEL